MPIGNIRHMMYGLDTPVKLENGKKVPAINLDNAATTPPFKSVVKKINQELRYYGSIGRGKGQKSEHSTEIYLKGRDIVKDFVGANSDIYTVFYVNSTTDGINKLASALIQSPEDMVLTTRMEHHSHDLPWRECAKMIYSEVDEKGRLNLLDIENILKNYNGKIKYVSVTAASNVTGYINDVHKIALLAHKYGAKIIVDGAQIIAHRQFSMLGNTPEENIDFFVFSSHKMYSPFGGGAVVGLAKILNQHIPKFYGGGMVEAVYNKKVCFLPAPERYEAGSPNYPGVVGMLEAIRVLKQIGFEYIKTHEQKLLKKVLNTLKKFPKIILYGDTESIGDRVGIITFNIQGIKNEYVANFLSRSYAIAVRHAAFCAHPYVRCLTGEKEIINNNDSDCRSPEGMVRISFGVYTTENDIGTFLIAVQKLLSLKNIENSAIHIKDDLCYNL